MIRKLGIALLIASFAMTACKRDEGEKELPHDEQNEVDDRALVDYLEDHYFESTKGLIKKYDAEDEEDDNYPSLLTMGTKLPSGVWIVKRDVPAEGPAVADNKTDSILISFNSIRFKASFQDLPEGTRSYEKNIAPFFNTIFSTGTPSWDPVFYYSKITDSMAENGIDLSFFVIEGFVEGLKHFNSTQTNGNELFNFQGAILVPSRMAYARDLVYLGGTLDQTTYRDNSFVFNFELHKVIPRNIE